MRTLLLLCASAAACLAQNEDPPQPPAVDVSDPSKAPSDALVLFDGTDLSAWTTSDGSPARCDIEAGVMSCPTGAGNVVSRERMSSAQLHLEFNVPHMPDQSGQLKGNSGVYLLGRYEIQILDSFENPTYANGSCGAVYGQHAPQVNASRRPGEWQTFDIVFHAPVCRADGSLEKPGRLTMLHNSVLVHDSVEVNGGNECTSEGPLMLQDHSGFPGAPETTMRFRNIWVRRLPEPSSESVH